MIIINGKQIEKKTLLIWKSALEFKLLNVGIWIFWIFIQNQNIQSQGIPPTQVKGLPGTVLIGCVGEGPSTPTDSGGESVLLSSLEHRFGHRCVNNTYWSNVLHFDNT